MKWEEGGGVGEMKGGGVASVMSWRTRNSGASVVVAELAPASGLQPPGTVVRPVALEAAGEEVGQGHARGGGGGGGREAVAKQGAHGGGSVLQPAGCAGAIVIGGLDGRKLPGGVIAVLQQQKGGQEGRQWWWVKSAEAGAELGRLLRQARQAGSFAVHRGWAGWPPRHAGALEVVGSGRRRRRPQDSS